VVGFGGRLVAEKGVDLVIRAAAAAQWRVVVLGDGPERRSLERLSRELGMGDRCHFAGHVESTTVPDWLQAFDALALASRATRRWMEQFGRILVEAMAAGVPVVGSASGAIPAVIGEAGILVPENDVAALTAALVRLGASVEERRALGSRGRDRVVTRFSSTRIAGETAAFYQDLIGRLSLS
jgi:glycosyltransferase involved in cell wall biosynthesis